MSPSRMQMREGGEAGRTGSCSLRPDGHPHHTHRQGRARSKLDGDSWRGFVPAFYLAAQTEMTEPFQVGTGARDQDREETQQVLGEDRPAPARDWTGAPRRKMPPSFSPRSPSEHSKWKLRQEAGSLLGLSQFPDSSASHWGALTLDPGDLTRSSHPDHLWEPGGASGPRPSPRNTGFPLPVQRPPPGHWRWAVCV